MEMCQCVVNLLTFFSGNWDLWLTLTSLSWFIWLLTCFFPQKTFKYTTIHFLYTHIILINVISCISSIDTEALLDWFLGLLITCFVSSPSECWTIVLPLNMTLARGSECLKLLARWRTQRNMPEASAESSGVTNPTRLHEVAQSPNEWQETGFTRSEAARHWWLHDQGSFLKTMRPSKWTNQGRTGAKNKAECVKRSSSCPKTGLQHQLTSLFAEIEAGCPQSGLPLSLTASAWTGIYKIKAPFLEWRRGLDPASFSLFLIQSDNGANERSASGTHTSHPKEISTFPVLFSSRVSWLFLSHGQMFATMLSASFPPPTFGPLISLSVSVFLCMLRATFNLMFLVN